MRASCASSGASRRWEFEFEYGFELGVRGCGPGNLLFSMFGQKASPIWAYSIDAYGVGESVVVAFSSLEMKRILILSLALGVLECRINDDRSNAHLKFIPPAIVTSADLSTAMPMVRDSVSEYCPNAKGVFAFTDTLELFQGPRRRLSDEERIYQPHRMALDSFETDGLEIVTDYGKDIAEMSPSENLFLSYPVYLVNSSPRDKWVLGKDRYVFSIQEALGRDGKWYPIECRCWDFCGNGHRATHLRPNTFFCFLAPKYAGNYKTKLRVRFRNGNSIYVSSAFDGSIQESQTWMPKRSDGRSMAYSGDSTALFEQFYGAIPR